MVINAPPEKQVIKGWRMDEGMQCDAEDFLARPVEPAALIPRIQRLLDRATRKIRVLIVDDHAVVRDGVRAVLTLQRDVQVVGEAVNGKEAVEKTQEFEKAQIEAFRNKNLLFVQQASKKLENINVNSERVRRIRSKADKKSASAVKIVWKEFENEFK